MIRRVIGLALIFGAVLLFAWTNAAHATVQGCTVTNAVVHARGRATFTVQGSCTVSLVAYELHGNGALAAQTQYDATTKEFSCLTLTPTSDMGRAMHLRSGRASQQRQPFSAQQSPTFRTHETLSSRQLATCAGELSVAVPACRHQIDLVRGLPRNPPTGYGPNVVAWRFGGSDQCSSTTTTTTSPSSTVPWPTSTSTPTSSVHPTTIQASTTANPSMQPSTTTSAFGTRSTPTELARTGGGEALGLGALLGLVLVALGRYVEGRGHKRKET